MNTIRPGLLLTICEASSLQEFLLYLLMRTSPNAPFR